MKSIIKKTKSNGTSLKSHKEEDMVKALQDVEDLMARILTPFFLLGDTARIIMAGEILTGTYITVGIRRSNVTPEVMSTLKTFLKDVPIDESGFMYKVGEVPVRVKFIRNNYTFFEHTDTKFYGWDFFQVPNPFSEYWAMKGFIR